MHELPGHGPQRTGDVRRSIRRLLVALILTTLVGLPAAAQVRINEAVASNVGGVKDEDDKTSDWIELYNPGPGAVDLAGYGLSDDPDEPFKWVFPADVLVPANGYRTIFASGNDRLGAPLHTNFKLSAAGETLVLSDPSGVEIDRLDTGRLYVDFSIGRSVVDPEVVLFFARPTPNGPNQVVGFPAFVDGFELDMPGGFYTDPVTVSVANPPPGSELFYSLDGSAPTPASLPWPGSVVLAEPVNVLRVRAFEPGKWPSEVTTATYLRVPVPSLPVLSLVMDPAHLWDEDDGMYENPYDEIERPMHVELFEADGSLGFAVEVGAEMFGFGSRTNAQKSFQLKARGGYPDDVIPYRIFSDLEIDEFRRLVLRNSGQDWIVTQIRDGVAQALVDDTSVDTIAFRSAITYLNGAYWGIYNMREHHDVFYTESHFGEDEIDMLSNGFLESDPEEIEGDAAHYDAMIDFMDDNNLGVVENYEYIQTQMDTDQFADYAIAEIFVANTDWPGNNIKYWRPKREGGRWRWMLFDTDFGLGLERDVSHDTLAFALNDSGPFWPNPPWSTKVLRNLVESHLFERDFINRYADYLNTRFAYPRTRPILLDKAARIFPEIGKHMVRWEEEPATWLDELAVVDDFLRRRVGYARDHIERNFDLTGRYTLSLEADPPDGGKVRLTAITPELPFQGIYFLGVPVSLTTEPANGFAFAGWSDPDLPPQPFVLVAPEGDYSLTALFTPGAPAEAVIHEINYNSADGFDPGDWVELHNPGDSALDLTGWNLRDDDDGHVFDFPAGTVLAAGGYLVVCEDLAAFQALFPGVANAIGDLGFGLGGNGDEVRLFDPGLIRRDIVAYDDTSPWPTEPDGNGPTLELIDPALDNNLATSWSASVAPHGSPGSANGR